MIPLLLIILTLIIDVVTDLRHWGRINHVRGAILRLIPLSIAAYLDWQTVALWPGYMVVFNIALNIGRRLPWDHIGETAWSDKLQRRCAWLQVMTYALATAGIMFYIWL